MQEVAGGKGSNVSRVLKPGVRRQNIFIFRRLYGNRVKELLEEENRYLSGRN